MTTLVAEVPAQRSNYADAPDQVKESMDSLRLTFAQPDVYKLVHPARWLDLGSGHHYETSYTNGEGRLRFYPNGQRQHTEQVIIRGLHPADDFRAIADLLDR